MSDYNLSDNVVQLWRTVINDHSLSYYVHKAQLDLTNHILEIRDCGEHHAYGGCKVTHIHVGEWGTEILRWLFNA